MFEISTANSKHSKTEKEKREIMPARIYKAQHTGINNTSAFTGFNSGDFKTWRAMNDVREMRSY